jgi:hypothetical protein
MFHNDGHDLEVCAKVLASTGMQFEVAMTSCIGHSPMAQRGKSTYLPRVHFVQAKAGVAQLTATCVQLGTNWLLRLDHHWGAHASASQHETLSAQTLLVIDKAGHHLSLRSGSTHTWRIVGRPCGQFQGASSDASRRTI